MQDIKVESDTLVRVGAADGRWFSAKSVVIAAGPYARPLIQRNLGIDLDLVTSQETVRSYRNAFMHTRTHRRS